MGYVNKTENGKPVIPKIKFAKRIAPREPVTSLAIKKQQLESCCFLIALFLCLLDEGFVAEELLPHIDLELDELSLCAEFDALDIGEFGQRIDSHGDEEGLTCFSLQLVQLFREIHGAGAVFDMDALQAGTGRNEGVLGLSIRAEHFFDGSLRGAVSGFHLDRGGKDMEAVFGGQVVGEAGFFFCGDLARRSGGWYDGPRALLRPGAAAAGKKRAREQKRSKWI